MNILAIDTSCDETSAAVLSNDSVLSNVISSQVDLHKKWGGVVPDIARRAHIENIDSVIQEALHRAKITIQDVDYFAATFGPGLAIALEVGLQKTQKLAIKNKKPFIPINHMEGHLLSSFAKNSKGKNPQGPTEKDLPAIGVLVSGGHTEMVYSEKIGSYQIIGETLDDAAGEAFDKVAKMLELGYPGGPVISEFAKKGNSENFQLPIPMQKSHDLNFSYSGIKTACLYKIRDIKKANQIYDGWVYDFCSSFQESVIKSILIKLEKAVKSYPKTKSILLGGGVMSNTELRNSIRKAMKAKNISVFQPYSQKLFTDNAAMIGIAAYYKLKNSISKNSKAILKKPEDIEEIDRQPVATINMGVGGIEPPTTAL